MSGSGLACIHGRDTGVDPRRPVGSGGQGGFTLIEMLVVVAVLAVLAGVAVIGIARIKERAEMTAARESINAIFLSAGANALFEGRATPSLADVQKAFDDSREHGLLNGPSFKLCMIGSGASCDEPGMTRVDFVRNGDQNEVVTAIVVHGKKRVLGRFNGFVTDVWIDPDGTIIDAFRGPDGTGPDLPGGNPLDPGMAGYVSASAPTPDVDETTTWSQRLLTGVTEATVDLYADNGTAMVYLISGDDSGGPTGSPWRSPDGCGTVTRTVVAGSGVAVNCPGDAGWDTSLTGALYGVACENFCRIHLSSTTPFSIGYHHIPTEWGGSPFTVQAVPSLVPVD